VDSLFKTSLLTGLMDASPRSGMDRALLAARVLADAGLDPDGLGLPEGASKMQRQPDWVGGLAFTIGEGSVRLELKTRLPRVCMVDEWVGATVQLGTGAKAETHTIVEVIEDGWCFRLAKPVARSHEGGLDFGDQRNARPQQRPSTAPAPRRTNWRPASARGVDRSLTRHYTIGREVPEAAEPASADESAALPPPLRPTWQRATARVSAIAALAALGRGKSPAPSDGDGSRSQTPSVDEHAAAAAAAAGPRASSPGTMEELEDLLRRREARRKRLIEIDRTAKGVDSRLSRLQQRATLQDALHEQFGDEEEDDEIAQQVATPASTPRSPLLRGFGSRTGRRGAQPQPPPDTAAAAQARPRSARAALGSVPSWRGGDANNNQQQREQPAAAIAFAAISSATATAGGAANAAPPSSRREMATPRPRRSVAGAPPPPASAAAAAAAPLASPLQGKAAAPAPTADARSSLTVVLPAGGAARGGGGGGGRRRAPRAAARPEARFDLELLELPEHELNKRRDEYIQRRILLGKTELDRARNRRPPANVSHSSLLTSPRAGKATSQRVLRHAQSVHGSPQKMPR